MDSNLPHCDVCGKSLWSGFRCSDHLDMDKFPLFPKDKVMTDKSTIDFGRKSPRSMGERMTDSSTGQDSVPTPDDVAFAQGFERTSEVKMSPSDSFGRAAGAAAWYATNSEIARCYLRLLAAWPVSQSRIQPPDQDGNTMEDDVGHEDAMVDRVMTVTPEMIDPDSDESAITRVRVLALMGPLNEQISADIERVCDLAMSQASPPTLSAEMGVLASTAVEGGKATVEQGQSDD